MTCSTAYASNVKTAIAANPSFKAICEFNIQHFPIDGYLKYYRSLSNGIAILQTHEQLNAYLACYADMHRHKLNLTFDELFKDTNLLGQSIEVVDWGCGQAFASCVLIDYIKEHDLNVDLFKFHLIEPSYPALIRGSEHIEAIYQRTPKPETVLLNERADTLSAKHLRTNRNSIKIHLFSNLIDICTLNLQSVANTIKQSQAGTNYFVCISPQNQGSSRLKTFYEMFPQANLLSEKSDSILAQIFRPSAMRKVNHSVSRVQFIFKTNL
ncbi:MAG: hypothetical protein WKF85_12545 [Chitinophagaceae bacterium]